MGEYDNWREVAAARHQDVRRRASRPFTMGGDPGAYDFNFKQFRSNFVMRWEYRPGSTLFLVWGQGREQGDQDLGNFRGDAGLPEPVLGAPGEHVPDQGELLVRVVRLTLTSVNADSGYAGRHGSTAVKPCGIPPGAVLDCNAVTVESRSVFHHWPRSSA